MESAAIYRELCKGTENLFYLVYSFNLLSEASLPDRKTEAMGMPMCCGGLCIFNGQIVHRGGRSGDCIILYVFLGASRGPERFYL